MANTGKSAKKTTAKKTITKAVRAKAKKLTPAQALAIIVAIIKDALPGADPKANEPLSKYGFDGPALLALRDKIYKKCGVFIPDQEMLGCQKISDVVALLVKYS